jgi:hypothetical protein
MRKIREFRLDEDKQSQIISIPIGFEFLSVGVHNGWIIFTAFCSDDCPEIEITICILNIDDFAPEGLNLKFLGAVNEGGYFEHIFHVI